MYDDFVKDMIKRNETEDIDDTGLSELVFKIWLKNQTEIESDQTELEEVIQDAISELGKSELTEDEDLNQIFFMFGYTTREDNRLEEVGFKNRLEQHYGLEFFYMDLFENLSRELGTLVHKIINEKTVMSKTEEVLLYQHIRACSIYSEVTYLIKGGFGTGALARFRSLHEIAVITEFIFKKGEEAAESYLDYLPVMQKKDIEFEENMTGVSIKDEVYDKKLQEKLDEIEKKRGKDFVNTKNFNDYVWAQKYLPKGVRPTFHQIRNDIERNHGIIPYKIASNNIHAAPRSLTSSISTKSGKVSGGASNIGLSLPGTWATFEMLQINSLIFEKINNNGSAGIYDRMYALFTLKMITKLVELLNENFPDKEEMLLQEE